MSASGMSARRERRRKNVSMNLFLVGARREPERHCWGEAKSEAIDKEPSEVLILFSNRNEAKGVSLVPLQEEATGIRSNEVIHDQRPALVLLRHHIRRAIDAVSRGNEASSVKRQPPVDLGARPRGCTCKLAQGPGEGSHAVTG